MECLIPKIIHSYQYNKAHLCREVGITPRAYYNILNGAVPRVDVALRICNFFNRYIYCKQKRYKITDLWK